MKKIIINVVCVTALIAAPTAIAMAENPHKTCCGEEVTTVDKEAFENETDAESYFKLLDEIFCGSQCP